MIRIYIAFVKKEIFHILRDRRTLFILFGMPIALVLIFGYTISNEFRGASIAILDQSRDDLSRSYIHHLTASGHFDLVQNTMNIGELEDAFQSGKVKMGIVIKEDFERSFYEDGEAAIQILTDATEPNYAATLTTYAEGMTRSFTMQNQLQATAKPDPMILVRSRMFYNPQLIGAYNFIPGVVALILMLICAMMTSLTIAREKEVGTMDLLLASPLPPLVIILGKVTPYVLLSFIDAIMVFAMGYFIFDVPVTGSLLLLLGLTLLYLMVALALGVLISARSSSQQTAMMTSLFTLLMPTMLLSGFIFPIASMPKILQVISNIIPAKYFILIEKAIMLKGTGMDAILFPTGILVLMLFVLLAAAWKNFKVQYK